MGFFFNLQQKEHRLQTHLIPKSKVSLVSTAASQAEYFFLLEPLLYGPDCGSGDNKVCSLHPALFLAPP